MENSIQDSILRRIARVTLVLLALSGLSGVQAAAIHKWVDADGVTHYSDEPPPDTQNPVTRLSIETGISTVLRTEADTTDHYYSIANQWRRMQRESLQRQQRELQRAALKRQQRPAAPTGEYRESRETRYVKAYPLKRYRKHRRGHYRNRPIQRQTGYLQQPVRAASGGFPTTN